MATGMSDDEGWEDLTKEEMSSTDPGVVVQIQNLLRAACGRPGQNRESPEQRMALSTLRELTLGVILIRCSMRMTLERDHPDVTALADRIFASHAAGEPFIRDKRYKTWDEIWDPERGHFLRLVSLTARSRCKDWLASIGRDPDWKYCASIDMLEAGGASIGIEPSRPDLEFEFDELERHVEATIERLKPGPERDAIRARFCRGMTAKEYAEEVGIKLTTAHMQMHRGALALRDLLIKDGSVGEGFGRNIISVGELTRKVLAKLEPGMTLNDTWKEGANGRA